MLKVVLIMQLVSRCFLFLVQYNISSASLIPFLVELFLTQGCACNFFPFAGRCETYIRVVRFSYNYEINFSLVVI